LDLIDHIDNLLTLHQQPTWNSSPAIKNPNHSKRNVNQGDNNKWPKITHLVYPAKQGDITLTDQNMAVQAVVRAAIKILTEDMLFDNAFPMCDSHAQFACPALIKATKKLRTSAAKDIRHQLQKDATYAQDLADLVRDFVVEQTAAYASGFIAYSLDQH
jgi:hypothetical protein